MISCTYAIGRIRLPEFFVNGGLRHYHRIPVYSNTKLALLLFTRELAARLADRGVTVNAADPGIVNTKFIHLDAWFDPFDRSLLPAVDPHRPQRGSDCGRSLAESSV